MCVIVRQPVGLSLNRNEVEDMFTTNPDGLGIMWAENGHVAVAKALPDNEAHAWEFYHKHCGQADREYLIHFRLATHGNITMANCHPIRVTGEIGLMHNGIMRCVEEDKKNDRSDTRVFAEDYLAPILKKNPGLMDEPALVEMMEHFVGGANIVALMRNDGQVVMLNGDLGEHYKGMWVSNKYWEWGGYNHKHWSMTDSWRDYWKGETVNSHIQYDVKGNRVRYDPNTGDILDDEGEATGSAFDRYTVSGFFALLSLSAFHRAHTKLSIQQVQVAMKCASVGEWGNLLGDIEDGTIKEKDLLACIRRPQEWFNGPDIKDKILLGV